MPALRPPSGKGLTLEMSAFKLFTMANLHYELSRYYYITMYYFVYYIDIIPLSWQEKQTFNHTWMKKIGSIFPSKKLLTVLAIRLKIKKYIESLQKQTMEVTFNLQNSKLLTFSLPTKENCTGTQHDGPVANIFALSYKKCFC